MSNKLDSLASSCAIVRFVGEDDASLRDRILFIMKNPNVQIYSVFLLRLLCKLEIKSAMTIGKNFFPVGVDLGGS